MRQLASLNYYVALYLKTLFFVLGTVGRFDLVKDHAILLNALKLVKTRGYRFRCILVGKGMNLDN